MPELLISNEMVTFAKNIERATLDDKLDWEVSADENILLAPLGGPFTAKLERVPRYSEEGDEYAPGYELVLVKEGGELFRLDEAMLTGTEFSKFAEASLRKVWIRAILKAKKVTEELNAVNRLLLIKLGPPRITDDDDEVPF